ncbi:MAG: hypothetical protein JXR96_28475 [Deltaproteobacteria bacterium]|nr:hypothetical protein [Deltaproteobacteria bacterium]
MRIRLFVALSGMFAALGCGDPFPPQTLVERLRPLAIRAEPPELGLLDEAELEALVADPAGDGRPITYTWAVCLFEFENTATDIPCPGPDSFFLPSEGARARLSMPELISWLAEQGYDLEGIGGELPDDVPMLVGLEVRAGGERVRSIKRVKVRLQGDEPYNHNPALAGVRVFDERIEREPFELAAGHGYRLTPMVVEGSQELFLPEGETEQRLEDHLFSWFSTAGGFSDRRTILDVDSQGVPLDANEWTAPLEAGPVRLWLIVRDGRYGVDWLEVDLEVLVPPAE